jgi:hypothetical protein
MPHGGLRREGRYHRHEEVMVKRACLALGSILLMCLLIAEAVRPAVSAKRPAVSADGVEIVFSAEGKGGPALVFNHGWSCDRSY